MAHSESLLEYALEEIRQKIQNGVYPPGTKLSTQELSDSLGISRTPVVSALNRLVAEGLAEAIPRRGVIVTRLSSKKIRDLMEARIMIEVYSVRFAVQNVDFCPALLQEMEAILDDYENIGDYDYAKGSAAEAHFHSLIVRMSCNDELIKMFKSNWGIGATYYMYSSAHVPLSQRTSAYKEHSQLLTLLKKRRRTELEEALEAHIRDAFRVLTWILDNHPENFS